MSKKEPKRYEDMNNKELMKHYDGIKFTNKHLKELFEKKKIGQNDNINWFEAFKRRNEYEEEVRIEILKRME